MKLRFSIALLAFIILTPRAARCDGGYIPRIDSRSVSADISEPTQKAVLIHCDGRERLILQVTYKGDVSEFVWLVPTPSKPTVTKYDYPAFHKLGLYTAPRIKYWLRADEILARDLPPFYGRGRGGGGKTGKPAVDVLDRKQIGVYDVAVLSARDSAGLLRWLRTNGYRVDRKIEAVLADYIRRGWFFTASRISTRRGSAEQAMREGTLHALQFDFAAPKPIYPLKISSLNHGPTKVLLYVCAAHSMGAKGMETICVHGGPRVVPIALAGEELQDLLYQKDWPQVYGKHWPDWYLTKLSGEFTPEQMTSDPVLYQAKSDRLFNAEVSPPFVENLGAVCTLAMAFPFAMPFNIITGLLFLATAKRAKEGSRSRRVLYGIAWYCTFSWIVSPLAALALGALGYWPVGVGVCALPCVAVAWWAAIRMRTRHHKRLLADG